MAKHTVERMLGLGFSVTKAKLKLYLIQKMKEERCTLYFSWSPDINPPFYQEEWTEVSQARMEGRIEGSSGVYQKHWSAVHAER